MNNLFFTFRLITQMSFSIALISVFLFNACSSGQHQEQIPKIEITQDKENKRIDITVDDQPFTSYLYTDTIADLKKTVLYPLYSADGSVITRGFPLETRSGERMDHPHHIGFWLNYGEVNDLDYWGNSNAIPAERFNQMGVIRNHNIDLIKNGKGSATLKVTEYWLKPDGKPLLKENTTFIFRAGKDSRIIDRITTLTALDDKVLFHDTKEGMMAIRTARAFEFPSDKPLKLSDAQGNMEEVPVMDNKAATGRYINSNGVTGLDVWGKRAEWCSLSGTVNNKNISIVIFDHPGNVGYPSYWHARGYGLFAINPLGQNTFSEGKETLNLTLEPKESVTLQYRLAILSGPADKTRIDSVYKQFLEEVK